MDGQRSQQRSLAELMGAAGDPNDPSDVVRFWLATASWDDSFEVLRAGASVLVTQEGMDAVEAQAEGANRVVPRAILRTVAEGWPIDRVEQLVTDGEAALDAAMRALAGRQGQTVIVVLALNQGLMQSPVGTALILATHLTGGNAQAMLLAAPGMARRDPAQAARIAAALRQIADALPEGSLPSEPLASLLTIFGEA